MTGVPEQPAQVREALPKPCLGCGAPMTVVENSVGLHGDPTLTCRFCARTESMPADAAAQARYLRMRLMQVRRAREALEAPLRTFEVVRQSWAIALVFLVAIGGWQFWQAFSAAATVPIESTVFGVAGGAAVVGVVFGYLGMHRAFRRLVRPRLQARPPVEQGLAARCRSCGGDLPSVRAAQVVCGYCGASNFLDTSLANDVSQQLAGELAEYQRRAHAGQPADGSAFQLPAKAFYRWAGAGAGATFVLGVVLALLR